jgi:hypothetical protein
VESGAAVETCLKKPSNRPLERLQERNHIRLLLISKANAEALILEVHGIVKRRGRSVMEIRRAGCQPVQNGSLPACPAGSH